MKTVQAVRNKKDIQRVTDLLQRKSVLLGDVWQIGLQLALRISDLLSLKYDDLDGSYITIAEGKTGKTRTIKLNRKALELIRRRKRANPEHTYIFQATGNRVASMEDRPVTRGYVSRWFKTVGDKLGLKINTHSMRKTLGHAMHKAGEAIERISRLFNHSSPAITMHYIGLVQDDIDSLYDRYEL